MITKFCDGCSLSALLERAPAKTLPTEQTIQCELFCRRLLIGSFFLKKIIIMLIRITNRFCFFLFLFLILVSLFKQLFVALTYLHEKSIAHRDLKPDNLYVSHEQELTVLDFGVALVIKKYI